MQVSYRRKASFVAPTAAPTKTVGKIPWNKYKDVTPKPKKNQFKGLGNTDPRQGQINQLPGYSGLFKSIKKKGFTSNYSK